MKPKHTSALLRALETHAQTGAYPMHMPGHKRNLALLPDGLPWALDVTEIHGFDELHAPEGILKDAMERATALFGALRSIFVVGGATAALLAAIRALTRPGDRVLVARNSHQAVYHALELCQLTPVYAQPPLIAEFGVSGSIPPDAVRDALGAHPDIALAVITSPTYEGVVSDVAAIAELLHRRGIPLLVDEAHGAHLSFSERFPASALRQGADIVVHGLHKTLPCLTQTAMLHIGDQRANQREVLRQLAIFESSSPSYPLMASIDACMGIMESSGRELLDAHAARLDRFYHQMDALQRLRVYRGQGAFGFDQSKVLIDAGRAGLSGAQLMALLRDPCGFELEMSAGSNALAMTSLCDTDDALERFAEALLCIDAASSDAPDRASASQLPMPAFAMRIDQALSCPADAMPLDACEGRVSGEYIWQYPPGVPLLVPGERVSRALIEHIKRLSGRGERVRSSSGNLPHALEVSRADC